MPSQCIEVLKAQLKAAKADAAAAAAKATAAKLKAREYKAKRDAEKAKRIEMVSTRNARIKDLERALAVVGRVVATNVTFHSCPLVGHGPEIWADSPAPSDASTESDNDDETES